MRPKSRHLASMLICAAALCARGAENLAPNPGFETAGADGAWPAQWGRPKAGGSYETEGGNRFVRLTQTEPGKMLMLYQEINIPEGAGALTLSWRERISGLKLGANAWFDARIMMEFMDAARVKAPPAPPAPYSRRDTDGWVARSVSFIVPEGAKILKFMPALFNVAAGTWDMDDIVLAPADPAPLLEKAAADKKAADAKRAADAVKRGAKADAALAANGGSLIANGAMETPDAKNPAWPAGWGGKAPRGMSYEAEGGNRFIRLAQTEPGKLLMLYRSIDLPPGTEALEMTWRQRVSGLKKGEMPWFDARFIFEFNDAAGKKIGQASPAYTQSNTDGWVERASRFLAPENAAALVWMPSLFQVNAGEFDIDDVVLRPIAAEPLKLAAAERARQEAKFNVEPEEPVKSKWPKALHVSGNKLLDADGKEVWLQGVHVAGYETLPHDRQAARSTLVALDEWKANCIRLGIKEEFWFGKSPYQKDGGKEFREKIDMIINFCANRGAYLALDLHRFRAPKQEHLDFWKEAAARYANHPAVLFDVFNEPHGISWDVWKNGGWVGNKTGADESAFLTDEEKRANQGFESVGMQALVDGIRSVGAKNIIIAGGLFWCNDLSGIVNGYALDDPDGNGIMYSWHTYNWHPGWARVLPVVAKHPVFLGECGGDAKPMGFIPLENQEDPMTFCPDMIGFIQKHKIHWTAFSFHTGATPRLLLDWDYTPTPFWGAFVKDALSGKQFEMKQMR